MGYTGDRLELPTANSQLPTNRQRPSSNMLTQRFLAVAITAAALAGIDTRGAAGSARAEKTGWVNLFDGATLNGWKANEHAESWTVKDGTLSCNGERS